MKTAIIGYAKAKALMLQGYRVLEVPRFRSGPSMYLKAPDGTLSDRIRSDSWDKLRRECHLVETQHHGKRGQHANYLWAYGELKSWRCTYWHPGTGETKTAIVHAFAREQAETKAWANACGWQLTNVEEA